MKVLKLNSELILSKSHYPTTTTLSQSFFFFFFLNPSKLKSSSTDGFMSQEFWSIGGTDRGLCSLVCSFCCIVCVPRHFSDMVASHTKHHDPFWN